MNPFAAPATTGPGYTLDPATAAMLAFELTPQARLPASSVSTFPQDVVVVEEKGQSQLIPIVLGLALIAAGAYVAFR